MARQQRPAARWANSIVRYADEDPSSLVANPRNWRRHPQTQTAALNGSLTELGWIAPVIVNETTSHVVDGHARIGEAISRGEPTVPVAYVRLTEDQERLALATFDPIAALAETDQAMLDDLLNGLSSDSGLSDLLESLASEQPKVLHEDDVDLTPPVEPITKPGDLWLLGDHRLLCGDSTKSEDVAWLMGGQQAAAVITDPPYNVDYDYGETTDDDKEREQYLAWTRQWFPLARAATTHCVVLTCGITNLPMWVADVERTHKIISWTKENSNTRNYFGPTSGFNVWEPVIVYGKSKKCLLRDAVSIPMGIQAEAEGHPCPKSLQLWTWLVENFSERGDLIFDPFIGAGTTIIAAEQLSRQAYGLEISPAYCDLTVRRWENLTGREAVRDGAAIQVHA